MENAFDAPYTFSVWPNDLDGFECLAVIGTRVRVRAAPNLKARILTALDFAIVRALRADGATPGWRRVQLADGAGATWPRSTSVAHRPSRVVRVSGWPMVVDGYIAGD